MSYIKITILLFLLFTSSLANDIDLEKIFKESKINGTLVISELTSNKRYIYNKTRTEKRFLPASTFKIPNTLISLEKEVIKDEYEIIKWDGKVRAYEPWNKDQNLQSAISISCVWCYQIFAKKIGNESYLEYLKKMNYGNKLTGSDISTFWLEGNLKISANEQIDFLKKLYQNDLPFSQRNIDITKKILITDSTTEYIIRAKSGWTGKLGWYVGYVEVKDKVWFFALNADIQKEQLKYRKEIVMDALKIKNIL